MQLIKPQSLGLSCRSIEYRRQFGLSVTAFLHLPFAQGEAGCLWGEQSMWDFLGREMAGGLVDEGVVKLTPEFLLHGRAWPPGGPAPGCAVRARLGAREKTLVVFGERHWAGARPSAPEPFTAMPLDWAHAWGGPAEPANPLGKGAAPQGGVHWLPNIERPESPLREPGQRGVPGGFGALEPLHPQRAQYRGTYGPDYLREHSPGFAPDLDWRHFNRAPPDQWFDAPLAGDEPFELDHLHPTQPRIAGRLPGLRVRLFADFRAARGDEPHLREVPLRLTTVWFFPEHERMVLLYQGLAETATDDASDIHSLLGAVERTGEPRGDAHYLDALARRADPRWGAVHALDDSDLLPEGIDTLDPDAEAAQAPFRTEGLQARTQRKRAEVDLALAREEVRALGKDPDAMGLAMPPEPRRVSPARRVEQLKAAQASAERQMLHALNDTLTQAERAAAAMQALRIDPAALVHRGPPPLRTPGELRAQLPPDLRLAQARERVEHLLSRQGADALGYLHTAHEQPPAHPLPAAGAATLRAEVAAAVAGGVRFFAGIDLTGADLSGLDLRGVNLAGAWLESADLRGSNLSGADLSCAVLAHARLDGAIAIGTGFGSANLGRARLANAVLEGADLRGALLCHAVFDGTRLRGARLGQADLTGTEFRATDGSALQAGGLLFYRRRLAGLSLAEAELGGAQFVECELAGADLRGARLDATSFVGCRMEGARLGGARGQGVVFAEGCTLAGADFAQARLPGANFGACDLQGAHLAGCVLDGANLGSARLDRTDLRLSSARGALLRRTVLRGARMAGINLHEAILQHADLRGADLRRGNLFGADLSRVRLDGDTRFDGALLERARTWPRLTPAQQAEAP